MIELRPAFEEALRNLGNWRNKYPHQVYPHKIVLNMMYRAYSTRLVYQAFANDEMPEFDDFQEAAKYVIEFYGETALREVMPYLEEWMANNPNEQVGSLCTARFEKLATQAETDKKEVDAIAKMSDVIIEPLEHMDYTITKQVFQQLLVGRYMSMNYHPLP